MIIIAGTIDFTDARGRDEAVALSRPFQLASRNDEPGCLAYCFGPDPCVETRVQVYELWSDEASLAAHFEHANYDEMRNVLGACGLIGAEVEKFRCDLREPVYSGSTPRADFFTA